MAMEGLRPPNCTVIFACIRVGYLPGPKPDGPDPDPMKSHEAKGPSWVDDRAGTVLVLLVWQKRPGPKRKIVEQGLADRDFFCCPSTPDGYRHAKPIFKEREPSRWTMAGVEGDGRAINPAYSVEGLVDIPHAMGLAGISSSSSSHRYRTRSRR